MHAKGGGTQVSRAEQASRSYREVLKTIGRKASRVSEDLEDLGLVVAELEPAERSDLLKRVELAREAVRVLGASIDKHARKEFAPDPAGHPSLPFLVAS